MPKCIFSTNSQSSGQPNNDTKTLFSHPPSPFHGNFCNCNSIGICTASRFYVQLPLLYTAWSNAYSEIGPEVRCDLLRLLAQKITKRIHSSKPASLNRPIHTHMYAHTHTHIIHSCTYSGYDTHTQSHSQQLLQSYVFGWTAVNNRKEVRSEISV